MTMTRLTWNDVFAIDTARDPQAALNTWLSDNASTWDRIASSLIRRYSLPSHMIDDIRQEVMLSAAAVVNDPVRRAKARTKSSLFSAVSLLAQDRVKVLSESSVVTGSTGMSTMVRRRRALAVHRKDMMHRLGREVGDAELIESFNATMRERRSHAERQGMIATLDDLTPLAHESVEDHDATLVSENDCPLVPHEAHALIRAGITACAQVSDVLGRAAVAYYGDAMGDPPHIAGSRQVADVLGVTVETARRLMRDVDDQMRQVLSSQFGI